MDKLLLGGGITKLFTLGYGIFMFYLLFTSPAMMFAVEVGFCYIKACVCDEPALLFTTELALLTF